MDVLIQGQEAEWVIKLKKICAKNGVSLYEKEAESKDIRLVVTDFPLGWDMQGAYGDIPFVVVSKDGREKRVLEAFQAGAEDYLIYPVSPEVAAARILRILGAVTRKGRNTGKLPEDTHFTPNEYKLLSLMAQQPGKVFTRDELLAGAFVDLYEGYDRNVDNYIKQIRKKLSAGAGQIETVYGVGYRFMP